ncbi:TIPRL family protein [Megaselia abdita]
MNMNLIERKLPINEDSIKFKDWTISYAKSHILKSVCINEGSQIAKKLDNSNPPTSSDDNPSGSHCCDVCMYYQILQLPSLPEMVFFKNSLRITHSSGASLEFNAMDALKHVKDIDNSLKVDCAEEWQVTRPGALLEEKFKPFDWTFSSDYQGTLSGFKMEESETGINFSKLMEREPIMFSSEVALYEDELHDHGVSTCNVKVRTMPSGFYVLLRFFLRVDNVLIRMNDSRFHFEVENNYIMKEFTSRECDIEYLKTKKVPLSLCTVPEVIEKHLPVKTKKCYKLIF